MAFDYSSKNDRLKIINVIKSDNNKKRKANSLRQFRCYSDNLDQYVQERLLQSFSEETFKMMPVISSINLVKRITDQSSSIYNMPPKREFSNLDKEAEAKVRAIYADGQFDNKLLRCNRFYTLQAQNHLYVKLSDKKLDLVPLLQHNIDAIPADENPEVADAYVVANFDRQNYNQPPSSYSATSATGFRGTSDAGYISPNIVNSAIADTEDYKATVERYTHWSKDYNFIYNGKGDLIGEDKDISNPIEMIPIIDVYQYKDFTYFVEQGSGVVEFCIEYNVSLTDLMFISRLQGFAQACISGDKEVLDKMTAVQLGPAHIIKLPNSPVDGKETKMQFLNRGSDITGSQSSIEMLISNFLTSKGIDPKTISGKGDSQKYASGTERLLAMIERFESSRADYDLFKNVEARVYELVKAYVNKYSGTEFLDEKYWMKIPEDSEVSVDFKRPELVQGEDERTSTIVKKIDAGLMSKVEAIMDLRSVTREKAEEVLKSIQKDNASFVGALVNNLEDQDQVEDKDNDKE
jgi:hypothetical protein